MRSWSRTDANRTGLELLLGKPHVLMILKVRSQGRLTLADELGHFAEIALHGRQLQQQCRRVQILNLAFAHRN